MSELVENFSKASLLINNNNNDNNNTNNNTKPRYF
jgi:hypothetical protein